MQQSNKLDLKVFSLPIYENYLNLTNSSKLYKHREINLTDCWYDKKLVPSKKKYYKPINYKKLYLKLVLVKKQYKKYTPSNWITQANSSAFSKNSLNISSNYSYLLRALNSSQLYKHQHPPQYKSNYVKGFTFENEKVLDKKKKGLKNTLFFFYCSKLDAKIFRQHKIEKKFYN